MEKPFKRFFQYTRQEVYFQITVIAEQVVRIDEILESTANWIC